jgi:DNA-directed RNA polymerase specialized sigma24 family protein
MRECTNYPEHHEASLGFEPTKGPEPVEPLDQQFLRLTRSRYELEEREQRLVTEARAYGWTNEDIGKVLGITRQAVGQKLRRGRNRRPGAQALVEEARQREEQSAIARKMVQEMIRR